jgi:superfamily II DNA or RNA helicase
MEKTMGTYYKHNEHQATITASLIAKGKKFTSMKLATASGKTYIAGMGASYYSTKRGKKVVLLTSSEVLKYQM